MPFSKSGDQYTLSGTPSISLNVRPLRQVSALHYSCICFFYHRGTAEGHGHARDLVNIHSMESQAGGMGVEDNINLEYIPKSGDMLNGYVL